MNFSIVRDQREIAKPTKGKLFAGDIDLLTLELPWKDNLPDISCIPEGTYRTVIAWSNRFQKLMPRLIGVPNRDGILIHPGNWERNTSGCILVGMEQTPNGTLFNSREAFKLFFDWLGIALRDGDVSVEISYGLSA